MAPPFQITPKILLLCTEIERLIGQLEGFNRTKPSIQLRKKNKVKTIKNSLEIEGNTLSEETVTDILEGKRVLGPKNEILEVKNAIRMYDQLHSFNPHSLKSFLKAHEILMKGLIKNPGRLRKTNVGVLKGSKVAHMAPKYTFVPKNMADLFSYIKKDKKTHRLISACVAHYKIEFIHPFEDGNGRMGRLWQTLLLISYHSFFTYIPVETVVCEKQQDYYTALEKSDKKGDSTAFIEFSLSTIRDALKDFITDFKPEPLTAEHRLKLARDQFGNHVFVRKDYMKFFKTLSTATASRDLKLGVEQKFLKKMGDKASTRYKFL